MSFCIKKYWIKTGEEKSVLLHIGNQAGHQQLLQKDMTIYNEVLILPNTSLCSSHGLTEVSQRCYSNTALRCIRLRGKI